MDAVAGLLPRRHPWLDRLVAAPAAEVRALAEGTASIPPFGRAEPSDAVATLLFGLAADDTAVRAFDEGALAALEYYRAGTARESGDERLRLALAALDLLTVIQRLTPHATALDLHRRFAYWYAWTETLVLDRGLDLRREYARALALTQDIAVRAGLAPRHLLPFWLELCGEAGARGRYDDSYLTVGLLGLRRLWLDDDDSSAEEAALHGLARWAERQMPSKMRFLREWHVLEGAYPHDPSVWKDLVARVLASAEEEISRKTEREHDTFPAAAWWREDVDVAVGIHLDPRDDDLEPPQREQLEAVLDDIKADKPFDSIEPRLHLLMQAHERYALRTGDTFYLVRTACNVGMKLLRREGFPVQAAARAREVARLALRFEPANVYAWALWRDAFAAEGHLEAAELVGWEAIRRFPENPQWRTQLATLLSENRGRPKEAEALLRGAMQQFPDNVVARNQLALLLTDRLGRPQDAEALLVETIKLFPDDHKNIVVARNQLATMIGRDRNRLTEAMAVLDAALVIDPNDQITQRMKRRFEQGRTSAPPLPAASPRAAPTDIGAIDLIADIAPTARARRALFRLSAVPKAADAARQEVEALLRDDENFAYARYVAAATDITATGADDTVMAAAFLATARAGSAAALRPFIARARGLDRIVVAMAAASQGDDDGKAIVQGWLGEPSNSLSPREAAVRTIVGRSGPVPLDLLGDMLAAPLGLPLVA